MCVPVVCVCACGVCVCVCVFLCVSSPFESENGGEVLLELASPSSVSQKTIPFTAMSESDNRCHLVQ